MVCIFIIVGTVTNTPLMKQKKFWENHKIRSKIISNYLKMFPMFFIHHQWNMTA